MNFFHSTPGAYLVQDQLSYRYHKDRPPTGVVYRIRREIRYNQALIIVLLVISCLVSYLMHIASTQFDPGTRIVGAEPSPVHGDLQDRVHSLIQTGNMNDNEKQMLNDLTESDVQTIKTLLDGSR